MFIIFTPDALPAETDARYRPEEKRHVWWLAKNANVELRRWKSEELNCAYCWTGEQIDTFYLKVRAMFDERRHRITAGIDKSYLLEPIVVDTKTSTTTKTKQRTIAPSRPTRYDQKMSNYSKVIVPPLQNRLINNDINGNNHFSTNDDALEKDFRGGDVTKIVVKSEKFNATKIGVTRKLTPAVSLPPPLKNVTNQKVRLIIKFLNKKFGSWRFSWKFALCFSFHVLSWLFHKIFIHCSFSAVTRSLEIFFR